MSYFTVKMYSLGSDLFEMKENEKEFREICTKLKNHPFVSPWGMCFNTLNDDDKSINEFYEFSIDELSVTESKFSPVKCLRSPLKYPTLNKSQVESMQEDLSSVEFKIDNQKVCRLKDALTSTFGGNPDKIVKDLDILYTIPLNQIPALCSIFDVPFCNEALIISLLNAVLQLEKPLGLATATALVHYFVYPKIFETKSSTRNMLTTILSFSETYPKAVIDEVMIPYLKKDTLEASETEILFKMAKSSLPNEYVSYCIKNILEYALPVDNTFSVLQCLIERKVYHEQSLYDILTRNLQGWTSACNSNLKFTKLLTSILSVYGSELTDQQVLVFDDVIKRNKTIIKRAAENLLRKIKSEIP